MRKGTLVAKAKLQDGGIPVAFRIEEGKQIPFTTVRKEKLQKGEHELTPKQNEVYKSILYSKEAIPFINELKNNSLFKDVRTLKIRDHIFSMFKRKGNSEKDPQTILAFLFAPEKIKQVEEPKKEKTLFGIKLIKAMPRTRRIDEEIYRSEFNRLSFKELGLSKTDIIAHFRAKDLIDF
jgi:hypothetical protein